MDSAEAVELTIFLVILLVLTGLYAWSVSWVIRDSRLRGKSGVPLPLLLLFGPFTALAWLVIRPQQKFADTPCGDYQNAEDAFHAASELDALGEWGEAIALFQYGAEHWPEHRTYAKKNIELIRKKQDGR